MGVRSLIFEMRQPRQLFKRIPFLMALLIFWAVACLSQVALAETQPLVIDTAKTKVTVFGESTLHDFTSVVTHYDLNIEIEEESGEIVGARFTFNFADLDSGEKKRDKTMLKLLSHNDFPTGSFSSSKITRVNGQWVVEGILSFHGVEKVIRFPFDLKKENGKYLIDAKTVIDYQNWNLKIIKVMGFLKVFPALEITIHVEGRLTT